MGVLARLKTLRRLSLFNPGITEIGLVRLQQLKLLEQLSLYKTQLSADALREFRRALPQCKLRI